MANKVHDDNVECINWQDLKDMGIPVAVCKQLTWIVRKRRLKKQGGQHDGTFPSSDQQRNMKVAHPGDYYPGPDEKQFMPNDYHDFPKQKEFSNFRQSDNNDFRDNYEPPRKKQRNLSEIKADPDSMTWS